MDDWGQELCAGFGIMSQSLHPKTLGSGVDAEPPPTLVRRNRAPAAIGTAAEEASWEETGGRR